ncbi:hypothetical protein [Nostoc sp.]|uniref:hypothetical protein n=1 Tax=Nostoc sp. TaxID=1180 RepID=UPI002FF5F8FE
MTTGSILGEQDKLNNFATPNSSSWTLPAVGGYPHRTIVSLINCPSAKQSTPNPSLQALREVKNL